MNSRLRVSATALALLASTANSESFRRCGHARGAKPHLPRHPRAFDKTSGITQGQRVADYVFDHAFAPDAKRMPPGIPVVGPRPPVNEQ